MDLNDLTPRERMLPVGNIDAFPPQAPAVPTVAPTRASGWQCPGCAGCYAPWVSACPACGAKAKVAA